jgi:ion channel
MQSTDAAPPIATMPADQWTLVAAAPGAPTQGMPSTLDAGVQSIEAIPGDIANIPFIEHMAQVMPAADLFFGATMLVAIVLIHAAGVRVVTNYVSRRSTILLSRPRLWRADVLMGTSVFLLLALHVVEIFIWAAALIYAGVVSDWRAAGFFAGNTYTTLGYGAFVLPMKWNMLAPIMAISGLFTFGWSASVLVDLVSRCQKIKDAVNVTSRTR